VTDWERLEYVAADRLWLRPLGLLCGRAAAEAVAAGLARPLAGPGLAFTLVAAIGLGSDRRPAAVTAPIAELEGWLAGAGARFADRARSRLALLSSPRPPWAGFALDRRVAMEEAEWPQPQTVRGDVVEPLPVGHEGGGGSGARWTGAFGGAAAPGGGG